MKENEPKDLTLIQIIDQFPTDEAARLHLEGIRWKDGIVCPHCKCKDQAKFSNINPNPAAKTRAGLRWCSDCKKPFTVTIGTIFESSHIPLRKWLIAFYMICSSKKGISSLQLQRNLELGSYRTALFMAHRIRFALKDPTFSGKLSGTVEVDETYIGGKQRGAGRGSLRGKTPVVSLLERGGQVRSQVMRHVTGKNLKAAIHKNVAVLSEIHTDETLLCKSLLERNIPAQIFPPFRVGSIPTNSIIVAVMQRPDETNSQITISRSKLEVDQAEMQNILPEILTLEREKFVVGSKELADAQAKHDSLCAEYNSLNQEAFENTKIYTDLSQAQDRAEEGTNFDKPGIHLNGVTTGGMPPGGGNFLSGRRPSNFVIEVHNMHMNPAILQ